MSPSQVTSRLICAAPRAAVLFAMACAPSAPTTLPYASVPSRGEGSLPAAPPPPPLVAPPSEQHSCSDALGSEPSPRSAATGDASSWPTPSSFTPIEQRRCRPHERCSSAWVRSCKRPATFSWSASRSRRAPIRGAIPRVGAPLWRVRSGAPTRYSSICGESVVSRPSASRRSPTNTIRAARQKDRRSRSSFASCSARADEAFLSRGSQRTLPLR